MQTVVNYFSFLSNAAFEKLWLLVLEDIIFFKFSHIYQNYSEKQTEVSCFPLLLLTQTYIFASMFLKKSQSVQIQQKPET